MRKKKDEKEIKKYFIENVENHSLEIVRDDGLFRHLEFSNNGSSNMYFNITTWPGFLCISGDMGCYVFSRIKDMFCFFRHDDINPSYWGEKLQSISRFEKFEEYSQDALKEAIEWDFEQWEFDTEEQKKEIWEDIKDQLIEHDYANSIDIAMSTVMQYESPYGHNFQDFWEYGLKDYTYHYLWCLYAIVWGIKQYDKKLP